MSNVSGPGGKPFDPNRFVEPADADGLNSGPAQPSGPDACGIVKPTEDHIEVAQPNTLAQLIGASPYPQSSPGSEPAGKTIGNPPVQEHQINQQFIRDISLERQNRPIGIIAKPPSDGQGPIGIIAKPPKTHDDEQGPIYILAKPPNSHQNDEQGPIYILAKPPNSHQSDEQGPIYIMAKPPKTHDDEQGPIYIMAKPPALKSSDEQGPVGIVAMPNKPHATQHQGPMGIIGDKPVLKQRLKV